MRIANVIVILLLVINNNVVSDVMAQTDSTPEFRIESQIYSEHSDQPVSQNVTLFTRGLVFDFQLSVETNPKLQEVAIYDERQRKLTLLDPTRQQQVSLSDLQLLKMNDQLRKEVQQSPRAKFLANEDYAEEHDWASEKILLSSDKIRYTVQGQRPKDASILPRYYNFLNQFTRLKASDPSSLPPFPRLRLNQSLQKLGWMPVELSVAIEANELFKNPIHATSRHALMMSLSDQDRQRMQLGRQYLGEFRPVGLSEYRCLARQKLDPKAAIKAAAGKIVNPSRTADSPKYEHSIPGMKTR